MPTIFYTYTEAHLMASTLGVTASNGQTDDVMATKLYVLGSNGSGQLMLEHKEDVSTAQLADQPHGKVHQIAAGGNHTIYVGSNGKVTAHGSNGSGQCNLYHGEGLESYRGASKGYSDVSATWTASILLEADGGLLFSCGEGLHGELGLGQETKQTTSLRQISESWSPTNRPIQLTSSMAHTVVVLCNGDVWGWGKNRHGQLGEPAVDVWLPRKIQGIPFSAKKAVCGKDFTCVIGDPSEGKIHFLGHGRSNARFGLPSSLPQAMPGWKDIAASWGSMFIVTANDELVGFGRNDHGQLPPPRLPQVQAIAAGSEHCLALPQLSSDVVLAWGWGEHGNCGTPTDKNGDVAGRWNEIEVRSLNTSIFAGCATSFMVTEAG